jgi:hypothetical protein
MIRTNDDGVDSPHPDTIWTIGGRNSRELPDDTDHEMDDEMLQLDDHSDDGTFKTDSTNPSDKFLQPILQYPSVVFKSSMKYLLMRKAIAAVVRIAKILTKEFMMGLMEFLIFRGVPTKHCLMDGMMMTWMMKMIMIIILCWMNNCCKRLKTCSKWTGIRKVNTFLHLM